MSTEKERLLDGVSNDSEEEEGERCIPTDAVSMHIMPKSTDSRSPSPPQITAQQTARNAQRRVSFVSDGETRNRRKRDDDDESDIEAPRIKTNKRSVKGTLDDPVDMRKYFMAIFWFSVVLLIIVGIAVIVVLASSEITAISKLQKVLIGLAFFVPYTLLVTAVIVSRHWHMFNNLLTHIGCFFSGATMAALVFVIGLMIYTTVP